MQVQEYTAKDRVHTLAPCPRNPRPDDRLPDLGLTHPLKQ